MAISSGVLRDHIKQRDLVSIWRAKVDSHSQQAFLLAYSEELLLVQYVYDFHLDGYLLLRRRDISELKLGKTNPFQKKLLEKEGVFEKVDFDFRLPIASFESFLSSLPSHEIVIVEGEATDPKEFLIGTVSHVSDEVVGVNHFTGVARITKPPEEIKIDQITCCQIRTNYIGFYQRYFERNRQKDDSPSGKPKG